MASRRVFTKTRKAATLVSMAGNVRRLELPLDTLVPIAATVWGSELNLFQDMSASVVPVNSFVVHRITGEGKPTELGIPVAKGSPFPVKRGLNHPLNPGEIVCYVRTLDVGSVLIIDEPGV